MDRLRLLILAIAATLWACHGRTPAPVHQDAGAPARAPDAGSTPIQHAPEPDPSSAMAKVDAGGSVDPDRIRAQLLARAPKRRPNMPTEPAKPLPPDPHAASCAATAHDKAALMACLTAGYDPSGAKTAATSAPDGGARHVFGSAVRPPTHCPALDVANWYFAPAGYVGSLVPPSDENSCVDANHPCLTPQEVMARWGCGAGPVDHPTLFFTVAWNFLGDMPQSTNFHLDPFMDLSGASSGQFSINCSTTTVATGTLSGVVAKNRAAGNPLEANLGSGTNSYVGYEIRNDTRISGGAPNVAWVDSDVRASDGGITNVAILTQPLRAFGGPDDGWSNGDSYTILRPGQLFISEMSPTCALYDNCYDGYPQYGNFPAVTNCWLQPTPGVVAMGQFQQSRFITDRIDTALLVKDFHLFNSYVNFDPIELDDVSVFGGSLWETGDVSGGVTGIYFTDSTRQYGSWLFDDVVMHGSVNVETASVLTISSAYWGSMPPGFGPTSTIRINGYVFPDLYATFDSPAMYGNTSIFVWQNGYYSYKSSVGPGGLFPSGITIGIQGPGGFINRAIAFDYSVNPVQSYVNTLTPANLFAHVSAGGFDGIALPDNQLGGYYNWVPTYQGGPTPYIEPVGNGGTGLDAGLPAGAPVIGGGSTSPYQAGAVCTAGQPIISGGSLGTTCGTICGLNDILIGAGTGVTCSSPAPVSGQVLEFTGSSPGGLSGLQLWLESNVGVVLSGSNVATWQDQSGNSRDASGGGSPATFSATGGPGGTPRLNFAYGQSESSSTNVVSSGSDRTVWVVGTQRGNTLGGALLFRQSTPYAAMYVTESSPSYVYSDGIAVNNTIGSIPSTSSHLFEWDYHIGSPAAFYVDGVSQTVSGGNITNSDTGSSGYIVGGGGVVIQSWSYLGQPTPSDIEEVIVVNHVATTADRQNIGGYVNIKYGLTISGAGTYGWAPVTPPWALSPVLVSQGGTGDTTLTQYAALLGAGTAAVTFASPGTAGWPLTSNGATSYPTFQQLAYSSLSGLPTLPTVSAGAGISVTGGPAYTVTNTGVTSVTGGTGISCSPTTGAATCTNTGATTVTGAGSTSCSPTSGAVTCTTTNSVSNGLTGITTCAAGDIVQGAGTSPFTCTNVAAQSLVVAQGTGVVSGLAPGTVGNVPRDNGSSWSSSKPANSSYAGGSTTTSTATWATVTSLTVVVPTGATLSVHADENMDLPIACASAGVVGVMGLGIDSSSVATVTSLVSLSAGAYDDLIDDFKSLALNYGTSALSAGPHTVYLLTENNSARCTITVNGDIVADVFP